MYDEYQLSILSLKSDFYQSLARGQSVTIPGLGTVTKVAPHAATHIIFQAYIPGNYINIETNEFGVLFYGNGVWWVPREPEKDSDPVNITEAITYIADRRMPIGNIKNYVFVKVTK